MFQLKRETDYAIQLLKKLSKNKSAESLSGLAEELGISFLFLQKIVRKLRMSGLVKSKQGADGGYILGLPLGKINLKMIAESTEGKCGILSCYVRGCPRSARCAFRYRMSKLNKKIIALMERTKLRDL